MITQQEYQTRRQKLAAQLGEGSIALIASADEQLRNGDAHYRFRQDSNFYYLTGFEEPESVLLLMGGAHSTQSILFNRPRHPAEEQWTGPRLGQEGALSQLLMNASFPIESLQEQLPPFLQGLTTVYYSFSAPKKLSALIINALDALKAQVRRGVKVPSTVCDLDPLLGEMRLFKSEAEQKLLREAARISVAAHLRALTRCKNLEYEYQLEAELVSEFLNQGCRSVAYDSIVGSGENSCVLHYTANSKKLTSGDLVLIDAGGEYQNYAADITRTFPINGVFSKEQKSIYELVLKAQQAAIALIKPGVLWHEMQQTIVKIITQGLCDLGLLQGDVEQLIVQQAYKPFYMHNSGHWLGLDVHDSGAYQIDGIWRPLAPGMVLTVEPGIYISSSIAGVEARWHHIGVRIEDDVLVTETGCEVLTAALPVEVNEIEALMRDETRN